MTIRAILMAALLAALPLTATADDSPFKPMDPIDLSVIPQHYVEDIQESLYRRGYDVTVDGIPGDETVFAITQFQRSLDNTPTGELTRAQQELLFEESTFPTKWGAISFSKKTGVIGVAFGRTERALAERMAGRGCENQGGTNCEIRVGYDHQWILSVSCAGGAYMDAVAMSEMPMFIERYLYDGAKAEGFDPSSCHINIAGSAIGGPEVD